MHVRDASLSYLCSDAHFCLNLSREGPTQKALNSLDSVSFGQVFSVPEAGHTGTTQLPENQAVCWH